MKSRAYAWLTLYIRSSLRITQWFLPISGIARFIFNIEQHKLYSIIFPKDVFGTNASFPLYMLHLIYLWYMRLWDWIQNRMYREGFKRKTQFIISGRIRLIAHWYYTFYAIVLDPIYDIGFGIHSSSTFLDWHNELHIVCFKFM